MTSKFKVGDKVRCIEAYQEERGRIDNGGIYTIGRIDDSFLSLDGMLYFEGLAAGVGAFAKRFELVERALEDWEQELLNPATFKPGDRVAVAFENVITSVSSETAYFGDGFATLAAPLSSLTKLTDPIPTADGAVIRLQNSVYELEDNGYWEGIGSVANYSHKEIQGWADTHGFTVLYAGDES